MKVASYPDPHDERHLEKLRELAPAWRIERDCVDTTTVLISGTPTRNDLARAPSLKAIIVPYAGVPLRTRELMIDFPQISVHNLHHNAPETAEVAIALMLACAKSLVPIDQSLRRGDWSPRYVDSHSIRLAGRMAAVLGFGAIGQRIARACLGLGMHVIAHRRDPNQSMHSEVALDGIAIRGPDEVGRTLKEADVVLLALPQTDETTGLIGANELAMMKPDAILVNIARAKLVDEGALYEALRSDKLRGAGLDVWYRYPEGEVEARSTQPSEYPFHELTNVVMSPHRGGSSIDVEDARIRALAELLNTEPMANRVDLARGY